MATCGRWTINYEARTRSWRIDDDAMVLIYSLTGDHPAGAEIRDSDLDDLQRLIEVALKGRPQRNPVAE
jgi:hypothetical protein